MIIGCVAVYKAVDRRLCEEGRGPEIVSPDGRFAVEIVKRNCGATTPFRTRIVLKDRSLPWILPYWFREETIVEYTSTLEAVEVTWTDPHPLTNVPTLLVVYQAPGDVNRIERQKSQWHGVGITYRIRGINAPEP